MTKISITKEIAITLPYRKQILCNFNNNANGTPTKYRVNGKCKTWKRQPNKFMLPIRRGLYEYGYVTETNMNYFYIEV